MENSKATGQKPNTVRSHRKQKARHFAQSTAKRLEAPHGVKPSREAEAHDTVVKQ